MLSTWASDRLERYERYERYQRYQRCGLSLTFAAFAAQKHAKTREYVPRGLAKTQICLFAHLWLRKRRKCRKHIKTHANTSLGSEKAPKCAGI